MSEISIHVIDVTRGIPAAGMHVDVFARSGDERRKVGEGRVGPDGAVERSPGLPATIGRGQYDIELHAGAYYRVEGIVTNEPAFQEIVVFRFTVLTESEHVHVPIKLSPWGFSIWRGR